MMSPMHPGYTSVRFLDILWTSSGAAQRFIKSTACLTKLVCNTFHWLAFSVKPAVVLSFKDHVRRSHRSMHEGGGALVFQERKRTY